MTEKKKAKKKEHYVNNKDFLVAITAFKEEVESAKIEGLERPRVSNYIGDCIMKIAVHLSHKPNFSNYTFKEEMICDGVENCLTYIDNFNPEKSQNPFAYFTQIIYYAFLRRIAKEKKHLYTKYKLTEELNVTGQTSDKQGHEDGKNFDTSVKYSEWSKEYVNTFIEEFETKQKLKRNKNTTGVDVLLREGE